MTDALLDIIAAVLIAIPIVDWLAVILLWRSHRRSIREHGYSPRTLHERGMAATLIAAAATLGGVLGVNRLGHGPLPTEWTVLTLAVILILPSVANGLWLLRAVRGDFERGEE